MDTNRLRQFCLIVEMGSLTKAAQLLHITHSGLSKSMRVLQDEFNCVLLQASGRGLALTQEGKKIYERAKLFLEQEKTLFADLENTSQQNTLRIAAVEIFLLALGDELKQLPLNCAHLSLLDLEPGHMEKMIAEHELDYGITYAPYPMDKIEIVEIGKFNLGCYHLAGTFKNHDLAHLPFAVPAVGLSNNPLGIKQRDGWLESLYPRNKKYTVNLLSTALTLTMQGLCAVYIPHFVANYLNRTHSSHKQLVSFPLPSNLQRNVKRMFLLRHKEQVEGETFKSLCKMLKKIIAK